MVIQLMIILIVIDRLRDTVRTFEQVKSQLDSTLETVTIGDQQLMIAGQDFINHLAL